jgi:hypothetical protein
MRELWPVPAFIADGSHLDRNMEIYYAYFEISNIVYAMLLPTITFTAMLIALNGGIGCL